MVSMVWDRTCRSATRQIRCCTPTAAVLDYWWPLCTFHGESTRVEVLMKVILFGTALLACAIPAFAQGQTGSGLPPAGQTGSGLQPLPGPQPSSPGTTATPTNPVPPGTTAPATPGCQPGSVLSGGPSSLVQPATPFSTGGTSAQSFGTVPSTSSPISTPSSAIGSSGAGSGIGSAGSSGVGSIGNSGIGSSGSSGLGSSPSSSSSSPFTTPLTPLTAPGSSSVAAPAYTPPAAVAPPRLPATNCP